MAKAKVGVINVTGYIGMELARLLGRHPGVELASVTGRSAAGQRLGEFLPHLGGIDLAIEPELADGLDLAFSALPHGTSAEAVIRALEGGIKVEEVSINLGRQGLPGDLAAQGPGNLTQRRSFRVCFG